MNISDPR